MTYHFGLIAKDIKNSVTPRTYEVFCEDLGFEDTFEIFNIPENQLEQTIEHARRTLHGFNVTMPYKQAALKYMDELDESAVKCGSTNTVLVRDGKLIAYNTDGWGLIRALHDRGVDIEGRRVVMLGAGGVACSIAYNLSVNGVKEVSVVNLFPEQTEALCSRFGERFHPYPLTYEVLEEQCKGADLFINASVMGQLGYDEFKSLKFLDNLAPGAAVFDVNYSNPDSLLVPTALSKGIPAWKGRCMSASQGIRAMEIWTGHQPSNASVERLIAELEKRN